MQAMKYWLIGLACLVGMISLVECAKAEERNTADRVWGIAAINDYIDKANVLVGDENGDFCSGTFISIKNRFVLTANHCVEDRVRREEKEFVDPVTGEVTTKTIERTLDLVVSKNIMKDYEVVSRQSFTAKVWARDSSNDVAILQITDPSYVPAYAATLAPDDYVLRRGETVYVVGNPGIQFDNSITKGIVSATERTLDFGDGKKIKAFQTDAVAIGGNSGGSVLNEKGEIIGTLDAGLKSGSITFVVPIAATKKLLKDKGYRDTEGPGVGAKPSSNQIDQKNGDGGTVFRPPYFGARPDTPPNGLDPCQVAPTLPECVSPLNMGGENEVITHLDAPRAQPTTGWPAPACWTPEIVSSFVGFMLPSVQLPAVIPANGVINGALPWIQGHNWSVTFKDGCATKLEVTR